MLSDLISVYLILQVEKLRTLLISYRYIVATLKSHVKKLLSNYIFSWKPQLILKFLSLNIMELRSKKVVWLAPGPTAGNMDAQTLILVMQILCFFIKSVPCAQKSTRFDNTSLPSQCYTVILTVEYLIYNSWYMLSNNGCLKQIFQLALGPLYLRLTFSVTYWQCSMSWSPSAITSGSTMGTSPF